MEESGAKMKEQITNYLNFLKVNEGRSDNTIASYKVDLKQLNEYLEKNNLNITNIKLQHFIDFLLYLDEQNKKKTGDVLSASTKARKITTIKSFFKYLLEVEGLIKDNPTLKLRHPKIPKTLPQFLTLDQALALIKSAEKVPSKATRNKAILTLFLNSGLRISELIKIELDDIRNGVVRVVGKGKKTREIPLNDMTLSAVNEYLKVRPKVNSNKLFITERNDGFSVSGMQYLIKRHFEMAGIDTKKYSTHDLRHTAATLMHNNGTDILTIGDILGHESVSTTQIYTHLNQEIKQKAVDNNPLNKAFVLQQ